MSKKTREKDWQTCSLADVTEPSNNSDLSSKHDIGGTLDSVDEGFAASVVVVELGLGDGVIDVDGGDLELSVTECLVEVVNTSGSLLRDTTDLRKILRVLLVDKGGEVTSVVKNHVKGLATRKASDGLRNAPLVFLLSLALPCKDGDTSSGDGSGSVILSREDVLEYEYQD
jgi:hypothetical protein